MANTLDQRILALIKKYMEKLTQKKVLTSMEEVEANTNETNLVAAPVVAELNNKLAGFEPVLNDSGEITGYKTDRGADTVFPFSAKRDIVLLRAYTEIVNTSVSYPSATIPCDGVLSYTFYQFNVQSYARKNGTVFASLTTFKEYCGYKTTGTLTVKKGDILSISLGSDDANEGSVAFIGRYQ